MSSFEDNYDAIVENNKNEIVGLLTQMHALGPAFQAFHQICKSHKIKPLRKRKGQYNPNKRALSAYNIFTQEVQNDPSLEGKEFKERSKMIGDMWKKVKKDKKKHKKYQDMAEALKKEAKADVPAEPAKEAAPKKAKGAKKPAKNEKKKAGKKAKKEEKPVDPSEVSEDEVYMSDSDDDVFDSDAEVSD